jgi:nucleotide-binding universal stress UspA family protein
VEVAVVGGNPAQEILIQSRIRDADVIVLGSHGRSGFERLRLGSVAEHVLRRAECPVLVVPHRAPDAVPAGPVVYRQIVCGVDFSPSSDKALACAIDLARHDGAQVTAVHAVELAHVLQPTVIAGPDTLSVHTRLRADARERLRRLMASHTAANFGVDEVLVDGSPRGEILRVAADRRADLIVLGAHGSVAGALVFGSTTSLIVREATCPVLTVRA